jgi:hypothetical protein
MLHSESIAAISAALAKTQGSLAGAKKDSTNPHFKSKYADLASVWDACREQLAANEIAVVQAPGEAAEGVVEMTTMLCHSSGEYFSEKLTIPLAKVDAQGYGSAVTYARRYALAAMVGIAPEDDDGNAATAHGPATMPSRRQQPAPVAAAKAPAGGWEGWGQNLEIELDSAKSLDEVEAIKARELETLRTAAKQASGVYAKVGEAFSRARADLSKAPEKKVA